MSLTAKGRYFWRSALQGIRHAPFVHVVAVVTLGMALFSVGLALGGSRLLEELIGSLGGEVQLTLYLKPHTSAKEASDVARAASELVHAPARVVSPKEALGRLSRDLGEAGAVLTDLPDNPLPTSVELSPPPGQRQPEALKALAQRLSGLPSVGEVDYGEEAVERLTAIARALRVGGGAALLFVLLATVVICSATLQLAIYARREEVEIQKLVGATDRFVKAPFLIEGALQGLAGAGAALGGLWAFFSFASPKLSLVFGFLRVGSLSASPLTPRLVLELLALGLVLGLGGSFVAVGRFLKV